MVLNKFGDSNAVEYIVKEFKYQFLVVISHDCDLDQYDNIVQGKYQNAFLPHILLLPAFSENYYRDGIVYKDMYNVEQEPKPKKLLDKIKDNKEDRYFSLRECKSLGIDNTYIIDFKSYITIPYTSIVEQYKQTYKATINSIFRENLSRKFTTYLSRIALPEIEDC